MAVLAALGGVTSTYVNAIGDATQAVLGFPGATQWAAGLHTIWIVLAMGILRKTGTGTVIGIIKGTVELMSGNTHGVIILLINLVAGLLVDFGFLIFHNKRLLSPYLVAGALSAGSNVIVFQLFATVPTNILAMTAILILTLIAGSSGLIFSGLVPYLLVRTLIKANVVKISENTTQDRKLGWIILSTVVVLALLMTIYLQSALRGAPTVEISGDVNNSYNFSDQTFKPYLVTRQMENRGVLTEYTGYRLLDVIEHAQPSVGADTLLIEAADGYTFLISFNELLTNPNILIVQQGQGQKISFDVVGPESSKAWVRNVVRLTVSVSQGLTIQTPSGETYIFKPDDWLTEMDSTQVALPNGSEKLQGVPLWKVIERFADNDVQISIVLYGNQESLSYTWKDIKGDNNLRIFTVIGNDGFDFVLANMSGEVHLYPLIGIEVQ